LAITVVAVPTPAPIVIPRDLTHIYSKLNLSSRVQVVQEAARHIEPADRDR